MLQVKIKWSKETSDFSIVQMEDQYETNIVSSSKGPKNVFNGI